MKDRRFLGQTIECPDCETPLSIRQEAHGGIAGVISTPPSKTEVTIGSQVGPNLAQRISSWSSFILNPISVAWFIAFLCTAGFIIWIMLPRDSSERDIAKTSESGTSETGPSDLSVERSLSGSQPVDDGKSPVEQKLVDLFADLSATQSETGAWPVGTAGDPSLALEDRFSWIAVLRAQNDPAGPQPRWDRAWNDRANERFVRQRQDGLLNPAIATQTGSDGYPTTHFVGVSGIGPDAARLPAGHPRAGVFGEDRVTTPEEISDGQANTMLVAGVESDLGAWAAAGHSTMRSFTAEPYVRGPDGFGSGQQEGMFVLMADGSTRFLSTKTDPLIIRQMAAVADGVPLDERVKGEPKPATDQPINLVRPNAGNQELDEPNLEVVEGIVADLARPIDEPLEVPLAPDVEPVDIDAMLAQPIARFEQIQPASASNLLTMLEEMLATTIDVSSLPEEEASVRLEQEITLSMSNTTVGDILDAVLREVGLTSVVRDNRLQVIERTDEAD